MLYGDDGDDQQEQAQPSLSSLSPSCLFLLWLMEDVQCDGEQQSVYRELLSPHFQPPRSTADYTGRRSGQHQPPASSTLTLAGLSSSQSVNWHKYHRLSHISSTPPHTPHPTSPHHLGLLSSLHFSSSSRLQTLLYLSAYGNFIYYRILEALALDFKIEIS